uniref:PHD-type domain-containing protein n=2 Tax=Mucochytrium quahogii TaxID=96639 RepID=A0A7S2SE11_9STRA|mmetsp:Transcript_10256/g.16760  ORF Transcript_10256/g.16760 Transcript_10256/m.16760 type:complete len:202 (+) Transcript_10256:982-1587(+)
MHGQAMRHGRKTVQLLPRELDRYPSNIRADFRSCAPATLHRYIEHYNLDVHNDGCVSELASVVASHFDMGLEVVEEDIVTNFVKFIDAYPGDGSRKSRKEEKRHRTRGRHVDVLGTLDSESDSTSAAQLYCLCRRVQFGEMIGCDNEKCKIEWFHVGCVGVKPGAVQGREWYCPDCREEMEQDTKEAETRPTKRGRYATRK